MPVAPFISEKVMAIAPDFRALSIYVDTKAGVMNEVDPVILDDACAYVLAGGPAWAEDHLAGWADIYLKFGAKPNRTPCSAQALRKRVLKEGRIPAINPVVDLYNAISLRYALPVGGENYDAYVGRPQLMLAEGTEIFDTKNNGEDVIENPIPGEVIWRDDLGVTCRRWNWRQGSRTRLDHAGGRMWFILESLKAMPASALDEAGDMLVNGIRKMAPNSEILIQKTAV
ncbi:MULTISPECIES: B3/4 domain-containing protein [Pseudochrobactrum]|uniref:B3/B4 domain-containing protein n=1 Tax=Pseudochrobactrum TaxID=354349 RepID=UPI001CE2BD1A|nr:MULTISPECIES: B3/4 domain-containing protein [Pseudochrobactrum]MDP8250301.1 B3/4 domain-containing protein [Pseudochrobactrum saccharolyticum]UCA44660.1 B3/4 domain-containing protein [Pseudochrobactrum sp. XF203]